MGDLGDWATNKVGDRGFGSKMGVETVRLGKYALGAWEIVTGKVGDSDPPPSRASVVY